ncbi:MAG TPA: ABC transporter ATP-binding protein [Kiritimatiellia bacterium]|nr:ABC transporter ATP-binding protein [Kiritimatiellia bacterium]HNS81065.1 ABC transporter ATP-binding protein [Kiritimatiellia bacterium]HPA78643.1 ABC transporter ATP-binding protein [Kiritimatiellia bacterium]
MEEKANILDIRDLSVSFRTDEGLVQAADRVSFSIRRGETLGLVGESGCGKSVTAMSILRLIPSPPGRIDSGEILFRGQDLLKLPIEELRRVRGKSISMIFQEPMTALSPLQRIGRQMVEALQLHSRISRREAWQIGTEWLRRVGMPNPEEQMWAWPHNLSGGMRQRVLIAMALMLEPALIIADEPTTALDVTIQAQIFDLMRRMKKENESLLLITHDMAVIWEMCDRVAVMYASEIVETGTVEQVFRNPLHPYTRALMAAIPSASSKGRELYHIKGQVPPGINYPAGCRFRERCPIAIERCGMEHPMLDPYGDQCARCFRAGEKGVAL